MKKRLLLLLSFVLSIGEAALANSPPKPDLALRALPAEPAKPANEDPTFRYDLRYELPITGVLLGTWIGINLAARHLAPSSYNFCERGADGLSTVNSVDASARSALRVSNVRAAHLASTIIAYGLIPATALSLDLISSSDGGGLRRFAIDAMLITEAAVVTGALTDIAKFTVGRARPYTIDAVPGAPFDPQSNLSFFSGHTSFAFAVATSAGTIATLRHSRYAPVVWALGMALAATTGYLRIAADKHYLTDVLTGAVVGSAVGFAVPYLHKKSWGKKIPSLGGGRYPEGGGYATAAWRF